jgi:hypothetical protein
VSAKAEPGTWTTLQALPLDWLIAGLRGSTTETESTLNV